MVSIKYSETVSCIYSDYGCNDSACPLNKLHVPTESTFGILDVPRWCLKTMDMVSDESLNSIVRDWIKTAHIKGKFYPVPEAVREIIDSKAPKITPPLVRWVRGQNVKVGPGVMVNNNREQPRIKNLFWHIWEKANSFLYKIRIPWLIHFFWSEWLWHVKFRSERP